MNRPRLMHPLRGFLAQGAFALLALAAASSTTLQAQTESRTETTTEIIYEEGLRLAVTAEIEISWPSSRTNALFANDNVHVRLIGLSVDVGGRLEYEGRTWYSNDVELRDLWSAIDVEYVTMGLELQGTDDCVRHSLAVWRNGQTVTRFCRVSSRPLLATNWTIDGAGFSGIAALKSRIREVLGAEREQARLDSARARASARERERIERERSDAEREEEEKRRKAAEERRARENSPGERERQRQHLETMQNYMRIERERLEGQCRDAEAAYRAGNLQRAMEIDANTIQSERAMVQAPCIREAHARYTDALMTRFSNGYTSIIQAVAQTFNVAAGPMFATFPLPKDELSGLSFGIEVGKGIYNGNVLLGNHIWAPVLNALDPVPPPDFSAIGCSSTIGTDFYGTPCSEYFNNAALATSSARYRVKFSLGMGVVTPKGLGPIHGTANLNYVFTDDGNLIVPGLGLMYVNEHVNHPRHGRIMAGGGARLGATFHQGRVGFQGGISLTW